MAEDGVVAATASEQATTVEDAASGQPSVQTLGRLLNSIPPFIVEYHTRTRSPAEDGVHAFRWVDGKLLDRASELALKAFNGEEGEQEQEQGDAAQAAVASAGSELAQDIYQQASAVAGSDQRVELMDDEECGNPECGKRSEAGQVFPKCARCGLAYCSKECQKADWRSHKLACYPERLRMHVPEEAEIAYSIKRMAVSNILPLIVSELSLAAVSWYRRLGRGLVVVACSNFIHLHSPDGKDRCQLYSFYFPEADADSPEKLALVPGLQGVLESAGGGKKLFQFDPEKHLTIVFLDGEYQLSVCLALVPPFEHCAEVLAKSGADLQQQDVFALDAVTGDRLLYDFHSLSASVDGEGEQAGEAAAAAGEEGADGQEAAVAEQK